MLTASTMTMKKVAESQTRKFQRPRKARSWRRECEGSVTEPKMPMRAAPAATRTVPTSEYFVKGSPRTTVAQMVLKTRPDCESRR
jgi:hypothetical protein